MKRLNWYIISTALVDMGLLATFISIDKSQLFFKIFMLLLFLAGFAGLVMMIRKRN
jgi:hypothetical protein